jgi:HEAT repeat protein
VLRCGILELREAAIQALREVGGPYVIPPLASVLADPDTRIAVRAAIALEQLREPAAWRALAGVWAKGHLEVRVRAVRALTVLGDEAAVPELCRALSDSVYLIRYEAASGFVRLAGPGRKVPIQVRAALPILRQRLSLLSAERPDIRNACRDAIQRIEAATAQMKQLPLPAAGEEPGPEQLPLPADAAPHAPGTDKVEAPGVRR